MHAIIPGCSSVDESKKGCVRKCQDNFSQGRRIKIHKHYWDLSKDLQNQWISYMVDTDTVEKENLVKKGEKSHSNFSFRKGRT